MFIFRAHVSSLNIFLERFTINNINTSCTENSIHTQNKYYTAREWKRSTPGHPRFFPALIVAMQVIHAPKSADSDLIQVERSIRGFFLHLVGAEPRTLQEKTFIA